ncbi:flagellar export chaperone FliS [Marinobacter manganoxydans]|jgi:flagellar protein FliS|uniref:Flagellar secretion chaperone FliS n=2 Tax=Marinobacter TaxID=2742 RepID=G6YQV8_9GAMM|nr:flagellar export chaperone FliS [Marinobacter manganoxydans]EHJ05415.1 flagellar protein FliS [Marinobacter manganoxydans MnI7-9]|tara:strand:- start:747 stop:1145 length:399 start_codon:yes stop_codon:yes gene_type:complete
MNGLQAYQRVNTQTSITDADPHRLIQLLYNGAIERINMAKSRIQAKDYGGKAQLINKAIEIIGGLRSFLDFAQGGDLAARLEALYDYMERSLLEASAKNDLAKLDEVLTLLRSVKEGWDGIREEAIGQQAAG